MTDPIAAIPKGKQTVLGLYVTAKEAFEMWRAAPDKVIICPWNCELTPERMLLPERPV